LSEWLRSGELAAAPGYVCNSGTGAAGVVADVHFRGTVNAMNTDPAPHVLAIDDDPAMRELIAEYLGENEFRVTAVASGAEMARALSEHVIDVIVLDLRLVGEDGMELARKLRAESTIPIIMVTGRKDEADRVMGLELGADDYLTKPFSPRELLARIRAVLRRYKIVQELLPARDEKRRAYRFAGWELNLRTRRLVSPQGARIELTNGEFSLLQAFCAAPRRILSRDQLLELSRLNRAEVYDRSIDVQILRLRRKIEPNPTRPAYIKTERGAGYLFDTPVEVLY
jgi:two-component system, OmpR family, response regulator